MTEQASSTQQPSKGDERHVVAVDPDAPQATIEERVAQFWKEYRMVVLVALVAGVGVIIGRFVWQGQLDAKERAVQAAYVAAESVEARLAFAREHAGHTLAAVALLATADSAYEDGDYATAAMRYAQAVPGLVEPHVRARARLGEAVASLQAGLGSKAEGLLRAIGDDATLPASTRAEAWYHLASHSLDAGNTAVAREAAARVGEIEASGAWAMRAAALSARIPADAATP